MTDLDTGVYEILNTVNWKRYIGSSAQSLAARLRGHRSGLRKGTHFNKHLQAAWDKYGQAAFRFSIIERCPPALCTAREQHWMDSFLVYDNRFGYNARPTAESNRGIEWSDEVRGRMSEGAKHRLTKPGEYERLAQQGRAAHKLPGVIDKLKKAFKGRTHTPEARERIAAGQRGRKKTPEAVEKTAASHRGKKLSDKQKADMIARLTGSKHSEETKAKMRASHLERLKKPEEKEKLKVASQKRWERTGEREKCGAVTAKRWASMSASDRAAISQAMKDGIRNKRR